MRRVRLSAAYIFLAVWAILQVWPVAWMLFSSVKDQSDIYTERWLPPMSLSALHLENYAVSWTGEFQGITVGKYLINSAIVAPCSLLLIVALSVAAGYSMARLNAKGSQFIFYFFVILIAIPAQALIIPLYLEIRTFGLINTYIGLVLPYVAYNLSFSIVISRAFYIGFPRELEEAAVVDGYRTFDILRKVVLPLSRNLVATLAVVNFPAIWNELFFALVIMQTNNAKTLGPGLLGYVGQYYTRYDYMFAGLSTATIPLIIFYVLFQKQIVKGVMAGAVKG